MCNVTIISTVKQVPWLQKQCLARNKYPEWEYRYITGYALLGFAICKKKKKRDNKRSPTKCQISIKPAYIG